MKVPLIIISLILTSIITTIAGGTKTGNVWGRVIDKNTLKPLIGVNISLQNNAMGVGTITNQNGEFRLWNLPIDTARILISYEGYQTFFMNIQTLENSSKDITVIFLTETIPFTPKDKEQEVMPLKKKRTKTKP